MMSQSRMAIITKSAFQPSCLATRSPPPPPATTPRDLPAHIIAFARQSLADPDWFLKVLSGSGEAVRVCEYTNYCEALDQKHKQVTCKLWDRVDLDEPGIKLDARGRRRLVAPPWQAE